VIIDLRFHALDDAVRVFTDSHEIPAGKHLRRHIQQKIEGHHKRAHLVGEMQLVRVLEPSPPERRRRRLATMVDHDVRGIMYGQDSWVGL
jgi:hypothetical protein